MQPGTIVGPYQITDILGQGGNARVYRVRHRTLRTDHALKVPLFTDPESRLRLLREGRLQAGLRHPNIVPVREIVHVGDTPALIMDFAGTQTLADVLARGPLSPGEARAVFRQICLGMVSAHDAGLLHRDLKPANILVADAGAPLRVQITDFGLGGPGATEQDGATDGDTWEGTLLYSPPERSQGQKAATSQADVFALGCIYYELLTGRRPFEAETVVGALQKMQAGAWARPAHVPRDALTVLEACLAPDPRRRARDAAAVLEGMGAGGEVRWRRIGVWVGAVGLQVSVIVLAYQTGAATSVPPLAGSSEMDPTGIGVVSPTSTPSPYVVDKTSSRLYKLLSEDDQVTCARAMLYSLAETSPEKTKVAPWGLRVNLGWTHFWCRDHVALRVSDMNMEAVITTGCGLGRRFQGQFAQKHTRLKGAQELDRLDQQGVSDWLSEGRLLPGGAAPLGADLWARSGTELRCPFKAEDAPDQTQDLLTLPSGALVYGAPPEIFPAIDDVFAEILTSATAYEAEYDRNPTTFEEAGWAMSDHAEGWLAAWMEPGDPQGEPLLRLAVVEGKNTGRQFTLSMANWEPTEGTSLGTEELRTLLESPHLGGFAANVDAGTEP